MSSIAAGLQHSLPTSQDTADVDIHCHCLPDLDDGPRDLEAAINLCRDLAADGIRTVVATPHQLGTYGLKNTGNKLRTAIAELQSHLDGIGVRLKIEPGGDVRVEERLVELLKDGTIGGLGHNGRHVLLELPSDSVFDLRGLSGQLQSIGRSAILSHPERHSVLSRRQDLLMPWIRAGVSLQVTAGSLMGRFGTKAELAAWDLLDQGMVAVIASDAHNTTSRPPMFAAARKRVAARCGRRAADLLFLQNPSAVLLGQDLITPAVHRPAGFS
jgi:protein-tyrosine phosphatase